MNLFFRGIALILHLIRLIYWIIAEFQTNNKKPKLEPISFSKSLMRLIIFILGFIFTTQLFGLKLFPYKNNSFFQILGFLLVIIGFSVSIIARRELGFNWAHAAEFQIRKNHTLVTSGLYKYIRHPIYTGIFLTVLGTELIVESYLFIPFFTFGIIFFFMQVKMEEKILLNKFGIAYQKYVKKTKMFLPYIW